MNPCGGKRGEAAYRSEIANDKTGREKPLLERAQCLGQRQPGYPFEQTRLPAQ